MKKNYNLMEHDLPFFLFFLSNILRQEYILIEMLLFTSLMEKKKNFSPSKLSVHFILKSYPICRKEFLKSLKNCRPLFLQQKMVRPPALSLSLSHFLNKDVYFVRRMHLCYQS